MNEQDAVNRIMQIIRDAGDDSALTTRGSGATNIHIHGNLYGNDDPHQCCSGK